MKLEDVDPGDLCRAIARYRRQRLKQRQTRNDRLVETERALDQLLRVRRALEHAHDVRQADAYLDHISRKK